MLNLKNTVMTAVAVCFAMGGSIVHADTLDKIMEKKELRVGTEAAMPPLEFVEDGEIVGLGKDILDYITEKYELKLDQTNLPWQGVLPGLDANRFDLVATAVTITPERTKKYAFTIPVDEATTHALKRADDDSIEELDDLNDKIGGTQLGSGTEASVRKWDEEVKAAGDKGLKELKLYTTFPEAYLALANGEIDVAFHTGTALKSLTKSRPDIYSIVDRVSDKTYYAWLTRGDDTTLRDFINENIKELIETGKMAELQKKWFGEETEIPLEDYLPDGSL